MLSSPDQHYHVTTSRPNDKSENKLNGFREAVGQARGHPVLFELTSRDVLLRHHKLGTKARFHRYKVNKHFVSLFIFFEQWDKMLWIKCLEFQCSLKGFRSERFR